MKKYILVKKIVPEQRIIIIITTCTFPLKRFCYNLDIEFYIYDLR